MNNDHWGIYANRLIDVYQSLNLLFYIILGSTSTNGIVFSCIDLCLIKYSYYNTVKPTSHVCTNCVYPFLSLWGFKSQEWKRAMSFKASRTSTRRILASYRKHLEKQSNITNQNLLFLNKLSFKIGILTFTICLVYFRSQL